MTLSAVGCRDDGEGQEISVADTGHAQSVPAVSGAGSLLNDPNREPECDWLHLWSYRKFPRLFHVIIYSVGNKAR